MGLLNGVRRAGIAMRYLAGLLACVWALPTLGVETDQFYAWNRELEDTTDLINAKVNVELMAVLDEINGKPRWKRKGCDQVVKQIRRRFRFLIFHDLELWANNSRLIDRVPSTAEEELRYRKRYVYHVGGIFDVGTWIPPSPTIEIAGIRIGTDKLTHFFSEGWLSYRWYRGGRRKGLSHDEAESRALNKGILLERTLLGSSASGVFSLADLEANYEGMLFFLSLCDPESPALVKTDAGWRMAEPFDFRAYVSPEWDESYQPSIYTRRRWKKVEPVIAGYCSLLHSPEVVRRRRAYAARDRVTYTERRIRELVDEGRLPDPERYSVERVCSGEGAAGDEDSSAAGPDERDSAIAVRE